MKNNSVVKFVLSLVCLLSVASCQDDPFKQMRVDQRKTINDGYLEIPLVKALVKKHKCYSSISSYNLKGTNKNWQLSFILFGRYEAEFTQPISYDDVQKKVIGVRGEADVVFNEISHIIKKGESSSVHYAGHSVTLTGEELSKILKGELKYSDFGLTNKVPVDNIELIYATYDFVSYVKIDEKEE